MGRTVVNTTTNVEEKVESRPDGTTVKTITTTTKDTFTDGSSSTTTNIKTITQGCPSRLNFGTGSAPKVKVTVQTPLSYDLDDVVSPASQAEPNDPFLREALKAHNDYRKKHHAPPLVISDHLCQVAQAWANKIAAEDSMYHSKSGFGENIYWTSASLSNAKDPVDSWYNEINYYNFGNGGFHSKTGHFTQVVWKGSTELGIAKATSRRGGTYVVANYNPPGNYMGKFQENVLRA